MIFLLMNGAARVNIADGSVYDQADTLAEAKAKLAAYEDENLCVVEADLVDGEWVLQRVVPDEEMA